MRSAFRRGSRVRRIGAFRPRLEPLEKREFLAAGTVLPAVGDLPGADPVAEIQAAALDATSDAPDLQAATPWTKIKLDFSLDQTTPLADPTRNLVYLVDATSRKIVAVDTDLGRTVAHAPLHGTGAPSRQMAVSPEGDRLFLGYRDSRQIEVFSLPELKSIAVLDVPVEPARIVCGIGDKLYVSDVSMPGRKVWQLDAASGQGQPIDDHLYWSGPLLRTSPDGKTLYTSEYGGSAYRRTVYAYDIDVAGRPVVTASWKVPGDNLIEFQVDEELNRVYTACGGIYGIGVTDTSGAQPVTTWPYGAAYGVAVAFLPGSADIYGGSADGIHRFRRSDGTKLEDLWVGWIADEGIEITPNGNLFFTLDPDSYWYRGYVGIVGRSTLQIEGIPVARISVSALSGLTASLNATMSEDYEASGRIVDYAWDFGDGTTASGPQVDHVFGQSGRYTVRLVVTDEDGNRDDVTRQIEVRRPNFAPVAEHDRYIVDANGMLQAGSTGGPAGVLANDWDPDDDPFSVRLITNVEHGTLVLDADGSFSYAPAAGFVGTDKFVYRTVDASGKVSNTAVAIITVRQPNLPPVAAHDGYAMDGNGTLQAGSAGGPAGVLANDQDPDGDPLTARLVTGPAHGALALNADGSFSYTPAAGFVGTDLFIYCAVDRLGNESRPAAAIVEVRRPNRPPVAKSDQYAMDGDGTLQAGSTGGPAGILANDWDPDGDPLTVRLITDAAHGALVLNVDGSFSYSPAAGFYGSDSFVYRAVDAAGNESNLATARVTVRRPNRPPVAKSDQYAMDGDGTLQAGSTGGPAGILVNDWDPDDDPITVRLVTGAAHGALVLNADGSFSYTPAAGFSGSDSFVYRAVDPLGNESNLATARITVRWTNRPPFAQSDRYLMDANDTLQAGSTGGPAGLLVNDRDLDGQPLTARLVSGTAHGALVLNPDGSFSYTPAAGFVGTDKFVYRAVDALGKVSNSAAAVITVRQPNRPPVAAHDQYSMDLNGTLQAGSTGGPAGVLANDQDPDGDPLTARLVTDVAHGVLVLNPDGSFSYTPAAGFVGTDLFIYRVVDPLGKASSPAAAILSVRQPSSSPVAVHDRYVMNANAALAAPGNSTGRLPARLADWTPLVDLLAPGLASSRNEANKDSRKQPALAETIDLVVQSQVLQEPRR